MCERYEKAAATWPADSEVVWRRLWQTAWRLQKVKSSPKAFGVLSRNVLPKKHHFWGDFESLQACPAQVRKKWPLSRRRGRKDEFHKMSCLLQYKNRINLSGHRVATVTKYVRRYQKTLQDATYWIIDLFIFFHHGGCYICWFVGLFFYIFACFSFSYCMKFSVCPMLPNVLPSRIPSLQRNWAKGPKWSTLTGHQFDASWFIMIM